MAKLSAAHLAEDGPELELAQWLQIADERLRPRGTPVYFMLANDDPAELADILDDTPWGTNCEGKVLWIDDRHEMVSWGYSNMTPWHAYREQDEDKLLASISELITLDTEKIKGHQLVRA